MVILQGRKNILPCTISNHYRPNFRILLSSGFKGPALPFPHLIYDKPHKSLNWGLWTWLVLNIRKHNNFQQAKPEYHNHLPQRRNCFFADWKWWHNRWIWGFWRKCFMFSSESKTMSLPPAILLNSILNTVETALFVYWKWWILKYCCFLKRLNNF